jgi:hypothetical protein
MVTKVTCKKPTCLAPDGETTTQSYEAAYTTTSAPAPLAHPSYHSTCGARARFRTRNIVHDLGNSTHDMLLSYGQSVVHVHKHTPSLTHTHSHTLTHTFSLSHSPFSARSEGLCGGLEDTLDESFLIIDREVPRPRQIIVVAAPLHQLTHHPRLPVVWLGLQTKDRTTGEKIKNDKNLLVCSTSAVFSAMARYI